MDFSQTDIRRFLADSIPSRFQDLSPKEFSSLMAFVFSQDGYTVDEIEKKDDPAGYLLANRNGNKLVLKAVRYPVETLVQTREVQEAAAAKTFYNADQSWIITTSSFEDEARQEAERLDIELWDWDTFYQALSEMFFEGKSHYDFVDARPNLQGLEIEAPELRITVKWMAEEGVSAEWYNLNIRISNHSDRHVYVYLDLPAMIDTGKNQVIAEKWALNSFISGMIYSGASVRTNALFRSSVLGERPPSGKVMLTCHERGELPMTYHLSGKLKGSACFIVTHCYGYLSPEYMMMIRYRDEILNKSHLGKSIVACYYLISPWLIRIASLIPFADIALKSFTKLIVQLIHSRYA